LGWKKVWIDDEWANGSNRKYAGMFFVQDKQQGIMYIQEKEMADNSMQGGRFSGMEFDLWL
jgi:hypothetical protein